MSKLSEALECRICGLEKPAGQFYRKAPPGKWGYHVCRECTRDGYAEAKQVAQNLLDTSPEMQITCRACEEPKALTEYYLSTIASHLQDFPVLCKACSKSQARKAAKEKKEMARQQAKLPVYVEKVPTSFAQKALVEYALHSLLGE